MVYLTNRASELREILDKDITDKIDKETSKYTSRGMLIGGVIGGVGGAILCSFTFAGMWHAGIIFYGGFGAWLGGHLSREIYAAFPLQKLKKQYCNSISDYIIEYEERTRTPA